MRYCSIALILSLGMLHAQSDNRYCNPDNTWRGITALNAVMHDGPAELPRVCFYTDPSATPSPGPVIAVAAGSSLTTAYNRAQCGSTLSLAHGAKWEEKFDFPAKNCDDAHWIRIRTDGLITPPGMRITPAYVPQMAQLNMTQTSGFISVGDHIRFEGLYVKPGRPGLFYFLPALLRGSNKVIFDRVYVACNPSEGECQHGITVNNAKYIAVIDSWMEGFNCVAKTGACVDSQAISGGSSAQGSVSDSGPVKIVNNYLEAST